MVERELNKLIIIKPNDFERRRNVLAARCPLTGCMEHPDEEKEAAEEEEEPETETEKSVKKIR